MCCVVLCCAFALLLLYSASLACTTYEYLPTLRCTAHTADTRTPSSSRLVSPRPGHRHLLNLVSPLTVFPTSFLCLFILPAFVAGNPSLLDLDGRVSSPLFHHVRPQAGRRSHLGQRERPCPSHASCSPRSWPSANAESFCSLRKHPVAQLLLGIAASLESTPRLFPRPDVKHQRWRPLQVLRHELKAGLPDMRRGNGQSSPLRDASRPIANLPIQLTLLQLNR